MTTYIEEGWNDFSAALDERRANPEMVDAMRCMFYGGARFLMRVLEQESSPGGDVTDDDVKLWDDLKEELEAFIQDFAERHLAAINTQAGTRQ